MNFYGELGGWQHDRRDFVRSLLVAPFLGVGAGGAQAAVAADGNTDLAAIWRLALDPDDLGTRERWFADHLRVPLPLPGTLEQQGIGHPVSTVTPWTGDINDRSWYDAPEYASYRTGPETKVPFFLQPDTWYRGPAWYQREIDIPKSWAGKRLELFLERAHWETRVWIDDRFIGSCDALHVPHRYDLGKIPPGPRRLTIRVDNRMIVDIGVNSHGVTDHTQGNWNGIAGRIELRASEPAWIENVALDGRFADRTLIVSGRTRRLPKAAVPRYAQIDFAGRQATVPILWKGLEGRFETAIRIDPEEPAALPWDEFEPRLHQVRVRLANGADWTGRFGWRELRGGPAGFTLNGRPVMFRGALDCGIFPLTGHPPTELAPWRRIMQRLKEFGLNHLRFHSYTPPEAALEAADEAGIYVQIEIAWPNQSTVLGSGRPVDGWILAETDRILAEYGNHPCIVMMTHGNEPGGGDKEGEARRDAWLASYVRHYKNADPRRLWTSGAGWPELPENQYHIAVDPRIQGWGQELKSRINAKPPETCTNYADFVSKRDVPVISHEIGQWCAYPALGERRKYSGPLKARNFDIFEDRLRANGLAHLAEDFHKASGRLQVACYKEDIESALRTPGMGGFQLLGLQDFSGQGTALVGVLDPFWDEKAYVTASEYRRFCGPVVPLARLPARVIESGVRFDFAIDVANFSAAALDQVEILWQIDTPSGQRLGEGAVSGVVIPVGNAPLSLPASIQVAIEQATAAKLTVTLRQSGNLVAENDWALWVYPRQAPRPAAPIHRASAIDDRVLKLLADGQSVLIGLPPEKVANYPERPVKPGFSSIFWNTAWTNRQAPTTLGILCDPGHPALADFPTMAHSDWQWWYLIHRAGALRLDLLPDAIEPVVRLIDDWFTARPLGLIIELAVGAGKAVVCGFALHDEAIADPVSRQILASLETYMASDNFRPSSRVSPQQLQSLMAKQIEHVAKAHHPQPPGEWQA